MAEAKTPADAYQETQALSASAIRRAAPGDLAPPPELRTEIDSAAEGSGSNVEAPVRPSAGIPAIPGYEMLGEVARGGMGMILRARDVALGRELAIKIVLAHVCHYPEVMRRFVEEAQITGQLQHPGIPPVHELGRAPDGRPYFTMKLIKGRTLAKLLKERVQGVGSLFPGGPATAGDQSGTPSGRPEKDSRPLDLPRFIKIFEQIAQTLAYAHARGVVHRDLKPLNIMVGKFGEVQVMDWGLAKVVGQSHTDTLLHTARTAGHEVESLAGRESLSDSGSPTSPPTHPTESSGSHQTQAGSVLGTPAYMPPEQANGHVELLDERSDVFALGSILCEVLTGRPAYVGREPHVLLEMARRGDLADALSHLDRSGAEADLIELTKACLAVDPNARPRDAGIVAQRVSEHLTGVQERLKQVEMERSAAQARAAEARATLTAERRARRLALGLTAVLVAGLGSLAWFYRQEEKQRLRAEASEQLAQTSLDEAKRNFDLALEATDAAIQSVTQGEEVKSVRELQKQLLDAAVPIFERLGRQQSADPKLEHSRGLVYQRLAAMRERAGTFPESLADFEHMRAIFAAQAQREPANPEHRRHLAQAYSGLGRLRRRLNQRQEAAEAYRQAILLQDQLIADSPENTEFRKEFAETHAYFGMLKADLGQPTAAEEEFRLALRAREQLARSRPQDPSLRHDWAQSLTILAWFQANQGQTSEAEPKFRQALAVRAELVDEFPKNPQYRLELSQSYFVLGRLLADLDERREAEDVYRKALAQQKQLVLDDANVVAHRQGLARSHSYLGRVLAVEPSRRTEADAEFREAIRLQEELAAEFAANPRCRQDLAASYSHSGLLLGRLVRPAEALARCQQALTIRTKLVAEAPDNFAYVVDLAESQCHLGRLALDQNSADKMLDCYSQALETLKMPAEKHVQLFEVDRLLRYAHLGRARALTQLGRHDEAAPHWETALRLINVRPGRGDVLVEAAVASARAAASLPPDGPWREKYLGWALQLIAKAHAAGHFRDSAAAAAFKAEAAFAILRGRAEFDRLVAELEKRTGGTP